MKRNVEENKRSAQGKDIYRPDQNLSSRNEWMKEKLKPIKK